MTETVRAAAEPVDATYAPIRNTGGKFLPVEASDPPALKRAKLSARAKRRHSLSERDYLRGMTRELDTKDMRRVVAALVRDAVGGEDSDPKTTNAAREWLGKYALGNGKHSLDMVMNPEVIHGKR